MVPLLFGGFLLLLVDFLFGLRDGLGERGNQVQSLVGRLPDVFVGDLTEMQSLLLVIVKGGRFLIHLGIAQAVLKVVRILILELFIVKRTGKAGEPGVQFVRVFHLGDHENEAVIGDWDRLDHERNIFCFKTELDGCLLDHVAEQSPRLGGSVSQLGKPELPFLQIGFI